MDVIDYWTKKHQKYSKTDWIDKPTIFAKFVRRYLPEKGKLLELGAGQGQDARFFAELGLDVLATDFSKEALSLLRTKAKKQRVKLKLKHLDLSQPLSYPNESFDVVYSHLALQYFSGTITIKIFDEIHRVLKPNGLFTSLFNTLADPEVSLSREIEEGLYLTPSGLVKRFFTTSYLKKLAKGKFKTILIDNKGETYKDEIKTLIRFVGRKI